MKRIADRIGVIEFQKLDVATQVFLLTNPANFSPDGTCTMLQEYKKKCRIFLGRRVPLHLFDFPDSQPSEIFSKVGQVQMFLHNFIH